MKTIYSENTREPRFLLIVFAYHPRRRRRHPGHNTSDRCHVLLEGPVGHSDPEDRHYQRCQQVPGDQRHLEVQVALVDHLDRAVRFPLGDPADRVHPLVLVDPVLRECSVQICPVRLFHHHHPAFLRVLVAHSVPMLPVAHYFRAFQADRHDQDFQTVRSVLEDLEDPEDTDCMAGFQSPRRSPAAFQAFLVCPEHPVHRVCHFDQVDLAYPDAQVDNNRHSPELAVGCDSLPSRVRRWTS